MLHSDLSLLSEVEQARRTEAIRQAAHWRLLRDAGLVKHLCAARWAGQLLCRLGVLLLAVGRRLEQYGPSLGTTPPHPGKAGNTAA